MEWVAAAGSLVGVLTFVFGAFHYIVLKPLKESIEDLKMLMEKIQKNVEEDEKIRHKLEIQMAAFEERLKVVETNCDTALKYCMDRYCGHD